MAQHTSPDSKSLNRCARKSVQVALSYVICTGLGNLLPFPPLVAYIIFGFTVVMPVGAILGIYLLVLVRKLDEAGFFDPE